MRTESSASLIAGEITDADASLETFAREKYMMKKDNEEVFVLVDEEGNPVE